MPDYIAPTIETDSGLLAQEAFDRLVSLQPGWDANEPNLETIIIETTARMAAEGRDVASAVPTAIFRWYGSSVLNLPPIDASPASVNSTWTVQDTAGYTIPQGTDVAIAASGDEAIAFKVAQDVIVPAAASSTDTGEVLLVAALPGAAGSGLTEDPQLVTPLDFVTGITLDGNTTAGGVDAETDSTYLNRLAALLTLLSPRPIVPDNFAVMARRVAGIFRAVAIDLYNPGTSFTGDRTSGSAVITNVSNMHSIVVGETITGTGIPAATTVLSVDSTTQFTMSANATATAAGATLTSSGDGVPRYVAVAVVDEDGEAVSSGTKNEVDALLQSEREINFVVNVIDPTYQSIDADFTAVCWPDFDAADVETRAIAALENYFSPANWGLPVSGEEPHWVNQTVVRYLEVAEVLNRVEGLHYLTDLTVEGGTSDVTLTGAAPLTRAGTITGSVTAP